MEFITWSHVLLVLCAFTGLHSASFQDYISNIGGYFGYKTKNKDLNAFSQTIPYEVSTTDEKFISEAVKLTGVALSELDSCQHRVILKLKTDCHKLNDEQLAKLAVHLLNCQSYIEGRQTYPCTEDMSIKDCTKNMDSDTWTIYHLMSNRARAVCYVVRQAQFRGLAENTVNRLMEAAKDQLNTLDKIAINQENIKDVAESTFETVTKGHEALLQQQQDMQKAQFYGQLSIEDNIGRLANEKRVIAETHNKLLMMAQDVQMGLQKSTEQLQFHTGKSKTNHQELIADLVKIQKQTQEIFKKIEETSSMLLKQNNEFKNQYEYTLKNLNEVNKTVHGLVSLVGVTRKALEDRLNWITTALGGTDFAVERLYLILWHTAFMLFAMLSCAFLTARTSTRLVVASFPPLNLAVALYGANQHLDILSLTFAIGIFILAQTVMSWMISYRKQRYSYIPMLKERNISEKNNTERENLSTVYEDHSTSLSENDYSINVTPPKSPYDDSFSHSEMFNDLTTASDLGTPTPPLSRKGYYLSRSKSRSNTPILPNSKSSCNAKTRVGTPCKLTSLPGREFCYRHQTGNSIYN